jgi:acetate kinase
LATRVLVLNCGSSSLKFQVVEVVSGSIYRRVLRGAIKGIGGETTVEFQAGGASRTEETPIGNHEDAVARVIHWATADAPRTPGTTGACPIDAVGHRVVHGGTRFTAPVLIDDHVVSEIESLNDLAPLHNPASIGGIKAARFILGRSVPMVAVFDTSFHHTIPDYASTYAVPYDMALRHRIRRYGFHGTAHRSLAFRYSEMTSSSLAHSRLITVQLGNGCSISAIKDGESIDTSMGFTPLEGLVMGTRSGDLDPAIILHLARAEKLDFVAIDSLLNEQSGLLGISGYSNDMGKLLERAGTRTGGDRIRLAIETFCYRVRKYIGSYLAVLGGADAIVFGGGIGENSPMIRRGICEGMEWCGLRLDAARNAGAVGGEGRISSDDALIHAYVASVDEELLIAKDTIGVLAKGITKRLRDKG